MAIGRYPTAVVEGDIPNVQASDVSTFSRPPTRRWRPEGGRSGRLGEVVDLFFHGEKTHYPCRFHSIIHGRFHVALILYLHEQ